MEMPIMANVGKYFKILKVKKYKFTTGYGED